MNVDAKFRDDALIKLLKAGKSILNCATLSNSHIRNLAGRSNDNIKINTNKNANKLVMPPVLHKLFPIMNFREKKSIN